jgi:DNA-binding transcriptional ArsR family regulator
LKPYQDITEPAVAKALAHPLRTRILAALEGRTASPSELATELDAPLGLLSYHIRRLASLGLVKLVKRVPRRGAVEHYYCATSRPRITSTTWGRTPRIVKQATIQAAVEQIGHYVDAAAAAGGFDAAEAHLTRSPVTVDTKGWKALARELDAMLTRMQKIESDSKRRLAASDHESEQEATVVLMLFNSPAEPARTAAAGAPQRAAGRKPAVKRHEVSAS